MRIVHCIFSFNTGGAETMLVDIVNEQVKYHEVHLVVINDSYNLELLQALDKRVVYHLIQRRPNSKSVLPFIKTNLLLWRITPDILHLHHASLLRVCRLPIKARRVLTLHTVGLGTPIVKRADLLIAISEAVKCDVLESQGLQSRVIPNGIRCKDIATKAKGPSQSFKILQVGRFDSYTKGCDIAIRAIAQVRQQGVDVSFTMIGDGQGRDEIEALITEYGLETCVTLLGQRSRAYIYDQLAEYDLLIQPSRFEGFGLTVAEGLAAHVPVLVSNIDGPIEIIDYGRYGDFFISEDVDDCAAKIKYIIEHYDEAYERAHLGYEHVRVTYSVERMVAKYVEAYAALLQAPKA